MKHRIEIVAATRLSPEEFLDKSPLGVSLCRINSDPHLTTAISYQNRRGLPEIYNARILAPDSGAILVFVHDDVWLEDFFLAERVIEALERYDVIGVAGNRRRDPRQPTWFSGDKADLSGRVGHGSSGSGPVSYYGETPAECEVLDGVFLAAKKATLASRGAFFDPRFAFHFYDLDFCRTARSKGLRLGTWPMSLTHRSTGAYDSPDWAAALQVYQEKWQS